MTKSIFVQSVPSSIELRGESKYSIHCPKCGDSRSKHGTKSLQVYRDKDGYIRWQCYHPGCQYNIRHAAVDRGSNTVTEEEHAEIVKPVLPIPFDPAEDEIVQLLTKSFNRVHWYKDGEDRPLFAIVRRKVEGKKTFFPLTLLQNGDWSLKSAPDVKALYFTKSLKDNPNLPIIVVEGEKAVDEGQHKFPNSILVAWPGGAGSPTRGAWDLIKGRRILLWPDNDEAGKSVMMKISEILGQEVEMAYTAHLPEKADVADDLTKEQIDEAIAKRIPITTSLELGEVLTDDLFKKELSEDQTGIPTGWPVVDESLHLKGLTVVEGRSSHGKSTVMLNLTDNLMDQDKKIVFYSYEMPASDILMRLALLRERRVCSPVPWENQKLFAEKIIAGKSTGYDFYRKHLNKKLFITDEYLNIDALIKQLSQPALTGAVVFIDYIQFIPASPQMFSKPRYLQIKDFAEMLKTVSKKNKLTIITGAQLTATSDRPAQDVAREGKDIYNASDVVLRIWNNIEGEQTETSWHKKDSTESVNDGILIVRKARAGTVSRHFDFNFTDTRKMVFVHHNEEIL